MALKYTGILFDLDGTLIDTSNLIIKSFRHTFKVHYNRDVADADVVAFFGKPLKDAMEYLGPDKVDDLIKTFREYNLEKHDELATSFDGVAEAIQALYQAGIKMAVVTSKTQKTALRGLKLFNLHHFFEAIIGVEQCEHHKPHPEPVLTALSQLDLQPKDCLMVGDSPFDLASAKSAGVGTVAVKWTRVPWETLLAEKPDYMIESLLDLVSICKRR